MAIDTEIGTTPGQTFRPDYEPPPQAPRAPRPAPAFVPYFVPGADRLVYVRPDRVDRLTARYPDARPPTQAEYDADFARRGAANRAFIESGGRVPLPIETRAGITAEEGARRAGGGVLGGESLVTPTDEAMAGAMIGGVHALGAVTFGLSDAILSGQGAEGREAMRFAEERHPIAAVVGEIGGLIVPAGGLTRQILRTAEEHAAPLVARIAGARAGRIAGAAAGAEAYQVSANVRHALYDPEHAGEHLVAGLGIAPLLGGGIGALVEAPGAVRGLARAIFRRAAPAAEEAAAIPEAVAPGAVGRETIEAAADVVRVETPGTLPEVADVVAASRANGVPLTAEDFASRVRSLSRTDRAAIDLYVERHDVVDRAARELRDVIDRSNAGARLVQLESLGEAKTADVIAATRTVDPRPAAATASALLREFAEGGEEMLSDAATWGERASVKRIVALAGASSDRIGRIAAEAGEEATGRIFSELDRVKQIVGKLSRPGVMARGADAAGIERIREWYEALRTHLEDVTLYGGAARMQARANAAWREFLRHEPLFSREFLRRAPDVEPFNPAYAADSGRVAKFLRSIVRVEGDDALKLIQDHFRSQMTLARTLADTYTLSIPARSAVDDILRDAPAALRLIEKRGTEAATINQIERFIEHDRILHETGAGVPETMTGAIAAGARHVARRAGATLTPTADAMRTSLVTRAITHRINARTAAGVARGVRGMFTSAGKAIRAARPIALPAILDSYEATHKVVSDFRDDPAAATRHLATRLGSLGDAQPQLAASVAATVARGMSYLSLHLPPAPPPDPLQPGIQDEPASPAQQAEFMEVARAVLHPRSVFESMEHGDITTEAVNALRTVYPRLYESVRAGLLAHIVDATARGDEIVYETRLRLGMLLDAPTDWSLQPDSIAMLQAAHAAPERAGQAAAGGPPRSPQRPLRSTGAAQTELQGLQAGLG